MAAADEGGAATGASGTPSGRPDDAGGVMTAVPCGVVCCAGTGGNSADPEAAGGN